MWMKEKCTTIKVNQLSKSNYDVLAAVLRIWYSEEQILEIWELLKDYDDELMPSSKKITCPMCRGALTGVMHE